MLVATHCHTKYSFDCEMGIDSLVNACLKNNISCTFITDHDVFSLTPRDLAKFEKNNILIINAIEFTTKEGVHIIGMHTDIKSFEKERYFYSIKQLINILIFNNGWISIPHPTHSTGVLAAGLDSSDLEYCFKNAHFIEMESSKYGSFNIEKILKKYKNLKPIVSDDAHKFNDIGIMLNRVKSINLKSDDLINEILCKLYKYSIPVYDEKRYYKRKLVRWISSNVFYKSLSIHFSNELKQKIQKMIGGKDVC
jgi:histidinol phosphatase-like PHP family hydrolase